MARGKKKRRKTSKKTPRKTPKKKKAKKPAKRKKPRKQVKEKAKPSPKKVVQGEQEREPETTWIPAPGASKQIEVRVAPVEGEEEEPRRQMPMPFTQEPEEQEETEEEVDEEPPKKKRGKKAAKGKRQAKARKGKRSKKQDVPAMHVTTPKLGGGKQALFSLKHDAGEEASPYDMVRVKSGIPGLDEMIEGGFEERSVVMVAGGPGTGKSTVAMQFIYNGIMESGENGLFISFEEKKEEVFKHMMRYGWDLDTLEKEKKLLFLEYPPHEVERFINEGGIIEDMINEYNVKRVAIDSITSFLLLYREEYKRRQAFIKTMDALENWDCTTLLTSEGELVMESEIRTRFGIEFLADALIALHTIRRGDTVEIGLEIVKMRGTAHKRKLSPLKFTENGIKVYEKQPVFLKM